MKKSTFLLLCSTLIGWSLSAQVTVVIEQLPKNTPKDATIFISGDFEGWSGGKKAYQLQKDKDTYSITLPKELQQIQFKFTQGSWKSVECDATGSSIDNRSYTFDKPNDTLRIKIAGWNHLFDKKPSTTAAKNVSVLSKDFDIPQLNRKRRVWLYLPPGYNKSKESYPVVYMHDGQNLFDANTSFSGEWGVDETLNKLFEEKNLKLIVVGIDNGGEKRLDEYSPWVHKEYGGGEGEAYVQFIVNTLKPYIDSNYRTLSGKGTTAIIGSSMGGLISHYAGLKYPEVFGKIGVYSPAFWFAPQVAEFSEKHGNIQDSQVYFLAGGKEGNNTRFEEISQTARDMNSMVKILKKQGFPSKNIYSKVVPEGKHNEALWRTNFEETILWLFPNAIKKRTFVDAEFKEDKLKVTVSDGTYAVQFYTSEMAETTFIPNGESIAQRESHAVVLKPRPSNIRFSENDSIIVLKSKELSVRIKKNPFKISYWHKGEKVISEKNGYQRTNEFETIQFNLTPDEVLYGGGARALGMNRRGNRLQLYNKAHYGYQERSELMNFTLPLVASSKMYMLHFDNAPIGYLDLDSKKNNTLTYETISGRKTYQVIVGDSWLDLVNNYTDLTGKQPLPPRWALGNFSSRFGYHSQRETEKTISKFKQDSIPVDAIILDLYWFGKDIKGTMGNLAVYKDSFPDMKGMIRKLDRQGVKTILITEPFVLTTSDRWKEAVDQDVLAKDSIGNPFTYDFYFGNTGLIDIYNPKGSAWFWNIYKELIDLGVEGLWGDLGEPEVHPSKLIHETGTAHEVHNIYGHDWAGLIYKGYQKEYPNKRPFILMRAGYSGSQRYGLIPWSGDVSRSWGGLTSQPEISLQMGLQGVGYMHSDLGGFAGANLDDELYVRWLQYGVFQPIFRPHAQEDVPSEPVFRSAKAKKLAKEAIELRYKLLPYNYTLAYHNHTSGAPLMRPLFFEEPKKRQLSSLSSTYLWGIDFLITPILGPKEQTANVYFPEGNSWFDFYSDAIIEGGITRRIPTKENHIPTFVRGGAFIPMAYPMQHTGAYDPNKIQLHYYHDPSVYISRRELYNDDGITAKADEKGMYEKLFFQSDLRGNSLDITLKAEVGENFDNKTKEIELIIHNIQQYPRSIKIGKKKIEAGLYKNKLTIPVQWNPKEKLKVKIKLKS